MDGYFTTLFGLVWLGWKRKVTDRSKAHFNATRNCGGALKDAVENYWMAFPSINE